MLSNPEIEDLFKRLDTNHDGTLDYSEFMKGAADIAMAVNVKILRKMFDMCDTDSDGYLERDEIKRTLVKCSFTSSEIAAFLKEVDENEDDRVRIQHHYHQISFEELKTLLGRTVERSIKGNEVQKEEKSEPSKEVKKDNNSAVPKANTKKKS